MTPEWPTVAVAVFAAFVSVIAAGVAFRQARHAEAQASAAQAAAESTEKQAREAKRANEIAERQHARDVLPELMKFLKTLTLAGDFLAGAFGPRNGRLAVADHRVNAFKSLCDEIASSTPSLPQTTSAQRNDLAIELLKLAPIARSRLQGVEINEEMMAEQNARYTSAADRIQTLLAEVRGAIAANEKRASGSA